MPSIASTGWKQRISALAADAKFTQPAAEDVLRLIGQQLDVELPGELMDLLSETDGVIADYGSGVIWTASEIVERNRDMRGNADFRSLYMPFQSLLFFGDAGYGDLYAYPIHADGVVHKSDIFLWSHETDARIWFAARLVQYFEKRLRR